MKHFTETSWFKEFVDCAESDGFTVTASTESEAKAYVVLQKPSSFGGTYADRIEFNGTETGLWMAMNEHYNLARRIFIVAE